jgi:electron transport complex protein RnfD
MIMFNVVISLLPVTIYGIILYGTGAILTILTSVVFAVAAEVAFRKITKQDIRIKDGSAIVTGLLLALVLPPSTPLWMTALGAVFAIIVAKEFFGGLGANVFNPALIGRAFLLMSFPAAITSWHNPVGFSAPLTDVVATATPLNIVKMGGAISSDKPFGLSLVDAVSSASSEIGETINSVGANFVASGLSESAEYWDVMKTLFFGNRAGSIGESSILLILAGAFYLIITKTIDWRAPLAMTVTTIVASFALGMDPLLGVLSGGILFAAIFMATDYVTAPMTAKGKLIFGFGAALIAVLIRKWGSFPEGATYGILIMNAVTPFLNRLLQKKYGFVRAKKEAAK